ncbi:MAG: L,D-transpeptidase family protein [Henriciella sp.]|uniref:L,D-transpeptidase family protein n=1 Tax=Henriciella sp. TaxID=1968823 RepID=UPI0032ECF1AB
MMSRLIAGALLACVLQGTAQAGPGDSEMLAPVATEDFHEAADTSLVWNDNSYDALIAALQALEGHGLDPGHYHLDALETLRPKRAERDRVATDAWMSAAAHMLYGKLDRATFEPDWTAAGREADLAAVLDYALDSGTVATSLEQLAPVQSAYGLLKQELARLRVNADEPVSSVSEGPPLKPGMTGPRVEELQVRLAELGLLESAALSGTMDEATVAAVEVFQTGHALETDGIAGASTIRVLNQGTAEHIAQVRVNMERWRWLPGDLGQRHLRANIAGFEVTAFENGEPQRTHLIIVGKTYRQTPVFSDKIEYIIFNPWWETPYSLARADKLPLFRRDPGAVQRLGFQVLDRSGNIVDPSTIDWNTVSSASFPYRLRQAPGPQNALGQVKIIFPNKYNVYLHDTPTRDLFARSQRAFSSGCLRAQDPIDLSEWLLENTPGWDRKRIDKAVASGKETRVDLAASVPVHVLYYTAVSDGSGGVRYLDDIYERDARVLAGLEVAPE